MTIDLEHNEIEIVAQTINKRFWSYEDINYPKEPEEDYKYAHKVAEAHFHELLKEAQSSVLILANIIEGLTDELEKEGN